MKYVNFEYEMPMKYANMSVLNLKIFKAALKKTKMSKNEKAVTYTWMSSYRT